MRKLVVLEDGDIADLQGATILEASAGQTGLLYITKKGTYVLGVYDRRNEPVGVEPVRLYRKLYSKEAAAWMIQNGLEVPEKLLASVRIF